MNTSKQTAGDKNGWKKPISLVVRGGDGPMPLTLPGGDGPLPLLWDLSIRNTGKTDSPTNQGFDFSGPHGSGEQPISLMMVRGGEGPMPLHLFPGDGPTPLLWEVSIRFAGTTSPLGAERTPRVANPTAYPQANFPDKPTFFQGVLGDILCQLEKADDHGFMWIYYQGPTGNPTPTNPHPMFDGFIKLRFDGQGKATVPSTVYPRHNYDGYVLLLDKNPLVRNNIPLNVYPDYIFFSVTPRPHSDICPILQWVAEGQGGHYADYKEARPYPYVE